MTRPKVLMLSALLLVCVDASAQRTTRPKLKLAQSTTESLQTQLDTIQAIPGQFIASGYEKTLKSKRESLFITNTADYDVSMVTIRIKYLDDLGRELHSRDVECRVDLPSGGTRMVDFPSWDKQCVWFYRLSAPDKASGPATPYDITVSFLNSVKSEDGR